MARTTRTTIEASAARKAQTKLAENKDVQDAAGSKAVAATGVIYQTSAQVLERAAMPNERFSIGDDMPVYYL